MIVNWPRVKVSELCEIIVDCVNKTAPTVEYETPFKMIRSPNIKNGVVNLSGCRNVTKDTYEKWTRRATVDKGDILLTREAPMGEVGLVNFQDTVFLGQRIMQYRVNPQRLDSNYLLYAFLSPDLQYQFRRHNNTGSTVSHIKVPDCSEFEISIPPLTEQKKISKVLRDLDKKISLNNKINTELEAMAKLIYDYWFVQFDFPNANGKPYKSSGGKMVYNEALKCEIPESWSDGTLHDLGEIVGGSTPSTKQAENFKEKGTPWITPKDLSNNTGNKFIARGGQDVSAEGVKSASLKLYPKNTILMSSRAPIGYMAIAREPLTTNQGFKSFIPNKGYSMHYIYYAVKNSMKAIVQYSSGSTFKEVSGSVLKTVKICLPECDIVESYVSKVNCIFDRQDLLELESKELTELRDWLLPMLMNGQVIVKDV
ncbi:type I restriction modification protein [Legionella antarctica]|uniref:Type I restriction modification protein n=1 Tax=Legionella antarctica TaxID=2708020 RepID=A0A6F8T1L1_9GAMM|nr:restriction endonuclease subunit S [Legionella antarctica]BCA93902.1 type I restriction modification protein [Legionella antarctica]